VLSVAPGLEQGLGELQRGSHRILDQRHLRLRPGGRERPQALLSTVGGQTALNLSVDLAEAGVLDKYGVTWVLYNANAPICQLLVARGKWKLVYADTTANILLKDTPENHVLIEEYKDTNFMLKE